MCEFNKTVKKVCKDFDISETELRGKRSLRRVAEAKRELIILLDSNTDISIEEMADYLHIKESRVSAIIEENKSYIKCPVCDGSGEVYETYTMLIGAKLFVCDVCCSCWEDGVEIKSSNNTDLCDYLRENGVEYD